MQSFCAPDAIALIHSDPLNSRATKGIVPRALPGWTSVITTQKPAAPAVGVVNYTMDAVTVNAYTVSSSDATVPSGSTTVNLTVN